MLVALGILLLASPPEAPACVQELNTPLQRKDFDALLTAAERCNTETGHPRNLYFIGVAQLGRDRPDQAIAPLQDYLDSDAPDEPPRLREVAAMWLGRATARVGVVELRVEPPPAGADVRLTIEHAGGERPIALFFSELKQEGGAAILHLRPGTYRITASRAGYSPRQHEFSIEAAGEKVPILLPLMLRPVATIEAPAPAAPTFPRRKWAGTWGGIAGGALLAGAPVFAVWSARLPNFHTSYTATAQEIDADRADLAKVLMRRAAGAGILSAGVGSMIGGLTGLARKERRRQVAWTVEAGLGGAFAVAGTILLATGQRSFNKINNKVDPGAEPWGPDFEASLTPSVRSFTIGAALLGVGAGLGVSAALGLISPKFLRQPPGAAARLHLQPDGIAVSF